MFAYVYICLHMFTIEFDDVDLVFFLLKSVAEPGWGVSGSGWTMRRPLVSSWRPESGCNSNWSRSDGPS